MKTRRRPPATAPGGGEPRDSRAPGPALPVQSHIEFRSAGGADDLGNRTTLCAWHHLRGVHAGVIRCAGRAPAGLRFALGLREGRPPLMAYASGDQVRAA